MAVPIRNDLREKTTALKEECKRIRNKKKSALKEENVDKYKQVLREIVETFDDINLTEEGFNASSAYARAVCEFVDCLRKHPKRRSWLCKAIINEAWSDAGVVVDVLNLNQPVRTNEFFLHLLKLIDRLYSLCDAPWLL